MSLQQIDDETLATEDLITRLEADIKVIDAKLRKM